MYDLRHFFASKLLTDGESLAYVSEQLDHAKQTMTWPTTATSPPRPARCGAPTG
jgi:site-specific recombinase XerD